MAEQLYDCEGISLESNKPFAFTCCDCGLTHHMVIVSEDGEPVGFAVKRWPSADAAELMESGQTGTDGSQKPNDAAAIPRAKAGSNPRVQESLQAKALRDPPEVTAAEFDRMVKRAAGALRSPPAGSREAAMVVLERDDGGTPTVWCDPEIADLVGALNSGGVRTIASCSGHGKSFGWIALKDGRQLVITPDLDSCKSVIDADGAKEDAPTDGERDLAALCSRLIRRLREVAPSDKLASTATDYLNSKRYLNPLRIKPLDVREKW